jgi:hypothetical protein
MSGGRPQWLKQKKTKKKTEEVELVMGLAWRW